MLPVVGLPPLRLQTPHAGQAGRDRQPGPGRRRLDVLVHADGRRRTREPRRGEHAADRRVPSLRTALYTHDYGDSWEHRIRFIETIPLYRGEPVCTGGIGDAPPENVGGSYGFEESMRVMANVRDPDHSSVKEWAHSQFFERYSLAAVNRRMRAWRTGELFDEWEERNGGRDADES